MTSISRLSTEDFRGCVSGLADLLVDAVGDGSSLGFREPFDRAAAEAWWQAREAVVAAGRLIVWVARGADGIAGTVSLALEEKPNGRHRADIVKLMVHRTARGRGLGRALLGVAEQGAAQFGASLMLLDTESGSAAEYLYHSAGWTRYGVVPGYAADPAGVLQDCSFFYKRLGNGMHETTLAD